MYVQGVLFFFWNFYFLRGRVGGGRKRGGPRTVWMLWGGVGRERGFGVFFRQGKGCGANVADRLMDDDNKKRLPSCSPTPALLLLRPSFRLTAPIDFSHALYTMSGRSRLLKSTCMFHCP